jgi:hypothetical protein
MSERFGRLPAVRPAGEYAGDLLLFSGCRPAIPCPAIMHVCDQANSKVSAMGALTFELARTGVFYKLQTGMEARKERMLVSRIHWS